MKKAIALLLFLAVVLLSSCGKPAEPAPKTTSDPTIEATTEPMPPLRASIIGEGVSYDVIKLDDAMVRMLGSWESDSDKIFTYKKTLYFPEDKSVSADYYEPGRTTWIKIILCDRKNGKETVLLEWSCNGHYRQGSEPFLVCDIEEQYALIHWRGWDADLEDQHDAILEYSLLDINNKKNIAIDFPSGFIPHFLDYAEGYLYFNSIGDEFYQGEFRPMRVKLSDFKDGKLHAAAVPDDVTITGRMSHYLASYGRYLAAKIQNSLLVFDMNQRACIFRLESSQDSESIWYPRFHEDSRYRITRVQTTCYNRDFDDTYYIEITLP